MAGIAALLCASVASTAALGASPRLPPTAGVSPVARAACTVADGTARSGRRLPSGYHVYDGTPGIKARFDKCKGNVLVQVAAVGGVRHHYNLAYGQRRGSATPIFSHQWERPIVPYTPNTLFATADLDADVYAFFRVQMCKSAALIGPSTCTGWSPILTVHLGQSQLTRF